MTPPGAEAANFMPLPVNIGHINVDGCELKGNDAGLEVDVTGRWGLTFWG